MDLFRNAKEVRLRSLHDKYLLAEEDEEGVVQDRNASSRNARWTVEFVPSTADGTNNRPSLIRLKSRYGKYLTASDEAHLLGMTGRKVLQTLPRRGATAAVEWEPIRDGKRVKLRSRSAKDFLRANGGLPPWRNSITHDVPHRTSTQEWVLWDVDVVHILETPHKDKDPPPPPPTYTNPNPAPLRQDSISASPSPRRQDSDSDSASPSHAHKTQEMWQSSDSMDNMGPMGNLGARMEGRVIYYHIAEEDGSVNEEDGQGYPLTFKGNSVEELTGRLREDTGIEDIIVCTRSPLNAKLYPLRLQLPPNTVSMHVVVVPSASLAAF